MLVFVTVIIPVISFLCFETSCELVLSFYTRCSQSLLLSATNSKSTETAIAQKMSNVEANIEASAVM